MILLACFTTSLAHAAERPNVLWLSVEDVSPHLGCYGDEHARTPNIDQFATRSVLYENAFVVAPVCAPCRSSIITGMYPTTLGTHNMRCSIMLPEHIKCFPEYLRSAGYYCTNNSKTDYQFHPPKTAWDESSGKAHWKNRPGEDEPFFAVFNYTNTHESKVRGDGYANAVKSLSADEFHDPNELTPPPYYPDTPGARKEWAQYYNCITAMDKWFADHLEQLDEAGLADDTIVFFWGDHGVGLPRGKRWLYDSGMRVPLIVHIPEKLRRADQGRPGTNTDELVALMDLGPTVLNLCGVDTPDYMQGRAFLGENRGEPREYIFAARDRMDERYDMIRAVRDKRFKYIRNYEPWKPYAQPIAYAERNQTMKDLRRLHAEGRLPEAAKQFMSSTKPVEELYDIHADPHELDNLADDLEYRDTVEKMARAEFEWLTRTRDLGFIPESQLEISGQKEGSRYAILRGDGGESRIVWLAKMGRQASEVFVRMESGSLDLRAFPAEDVLDSDDAAMRWWQVHLMQRLVGESESIRSAVESRLNDPDGAVRAAAALAMLGHNNLEAAVEQLAKDLSDDNWYVRLRAANIVESIGDKAAPAMDEIRQAHQEATAPGDKPYPARFVGWATDTILKRN